MSREKPLTLAEVQVKYVAAAVLALLVVAVIIWAQVERSREQAEFQEVWCQSRWSEGDPECL